MPNPGAEASHGGMQYIKTIPGILKLLQAVFSLSGFIIAQSCWLKYVGKGVFFSLVTMLGCLLTAVLLGLHLFDMLERFRNIPWLKVELGFCAAWSLMCLLASILAATVTEAELIMAMVSSMTGGGMLDAVMSEAINSESYQLYHEMPKNLSIYAALFGFAATAAYAVDTYRRWVELRAGRPKPVADAEAPSRLQ